MTIVKIQEKGKNPIKMCDLLDEVKKSPKIDECGAIFSFEGIVRGKEKGVKVEKLDLTITDRKKTEEELIKIINDIKDKYGVAEIAVVHYLGEFNVGESLFVVVVAGSHRQETIGALKESIERVKYELDFKKEERTGEGTNIIMSGG
jgi:molybdopterin synthase catalytic subunit